VWPWVPGRDLAGRLRRHGPPEPGWARTIVTDLDATLAALHDRGLVHGALSADHVLLDAGGRPSLIGLEPGARAGAGTRAADLAAMAEIRGLLLAEGNGPEPAAVPEAPGPEGLAPGRHRRLLTVAVGVTIVAAGALGTLAGADAGRSCPSGDGTGGHRADVDGDGCEDRLEWSAETGRLWADTGSGPRAWQLGRPGDRFLLGDWDCDGALTPGLHRPANGLTYGFDRWPSERPVAAEPVDDPRRCGNEP
jgi:hypothetical protein